MTKRMGVGRWLAVELVFDTSVIGALWFATGSLINAVLIAWAAFTVGAVRSGIERRRRVASQRHLLRAEIARLYAAKVKS